MKLVPLESPLEGEWMVLNSSGSKVPSHGTDSFASTYAFDLLQWTGPKNQLNSTGKVPWIRS